MSKKIKFTGFNSGIAGEKFHLSFQEYNKDTKFLSLVENQEITISNNDYDLLPQNLFDSGTLVLIEDNNLLLVNNQVGVLSSVILSVDSFPRLNGETEDSPRIQRAINSLPSTGGEIIFPPKSSSYVLNTTFSINGKANIKLRAIKGSKFIIGVGLNFFNVIGSNHITLEGFEFEESGYTNNVFFQDVTLNHATLLQPNTNTNIDVTITSPTFTIAKNGTTPDQVEQYYNVTIALDSSKEYTIQTYDGFAVGENINRIKIRQYTDATTYKEASLDLQVLDAASPGYYRWLTNYIPIGIVKIELLFAYTKAFNSDNNNAIYDLSKIRLFQASRPLPNNVDSFHISVQNSKQITFQDMKFKGMTVDVIKVISASEDIKMRDLEFINCFNDNIGVGYITNGIFENIYSKNEFVSNSAAVVAYTKSTNRVFGGSVASKNITIKNIYGKGMYFGAELWFVDNMLIDNVTFENVPWGLSICNNTTGKIQNATFRLSDNWKFAIELATGVKVDVDNVRVTGRSIMGFVFSLTSNTAGKVNISNVVVDSCFCIAQYTDNSIFFQNIEVKELIGIGFFGLQGGDYSNATLSVEDSKITFSNTLKICNPAYASAFIRTNDGTKYMNRIILKNCEFLGKPNQHAFGIRTSELLMDNVITDNATFYFSQIRLKDVNDKMSIIRNSQMYKWNFAEFPTTATTSKLVFRDSKIKSTTLPSGTHVITDNIVTMI